ncbi:RNA polymerase sigma factor [Candidatus Aminicenantes bacterium AC-335-A11]|jgi:RNA polymerase sigma-70 factor (ECF subfamily)|nr:RNA polymerase sigma factor [SCandidatus Aminicenantes bacterium Aminicenantia_JdfR_composite]MCP2598347.1 RNA polymerase sigma factor [Candidatus Aminicenantes bacterium AC-335-L06]MCP2618593.1 RNA polymerase sigma factor [Candidatus Aminicenantes bacterium AC-335-A11]MCP2621057.1 RNA polymerase sigma factor [Candidatus Aminicenantes bacterium AC-334-E05]
MQSGKEIKKKNEPEKEIIRRIKCGDKEAFNFLIKLYQKKIFRLAYCYFQDEEEAMEIVQETFLRVYQKIKYFTEGRNFQNWIYKIASNLCIDHYRKLHRTNKLINKLKENHTVHTLDERQSSASDFKEILKKSIQYLPYKQKMVFIMKYYEGLKYNEISKIMKISIGTAKSLNHRAIKSLQSIVNRFIRGNKNEKMQKN